MSNGEIHGWKAFVLSQKLKDLNLVLEVWNKQVFCSIYSRIDLLKEVVNNVDSLVYNRVLFDKKIETRSEVIMTMWSLIRIRVSQLFQRFRSKCLKEGDSNSVFFSCLC